MQKRLIVSLNSDKVDSYRASLNYLTKRYTDPERLYNLPEFHTLPPAQYAETTQTALMEISVEKSRNNYFISPRNFMLHDNSQPGLKVMTHACYLKDGLAVLYDERLEVFDSWNGKRIREYSYHFMHGSHTVYPVDDSRLLLSASSLDGFFIVNIHSGEVERKFRVPKALYGENYPLTSEQDTRVNYIHNDLQLAHLNSAYPCRNGSVLISTLIQGDIAIVSENNDYDLMRRGFVGAHNARESENGEIYFSDSCNGNLVLLSGNKEIKQRFDFNSKWLHDCIQIENELFLGSVADRQMLVLVDVSTGETLCEYDLGKEASMTPKFFSVPT